MTMQPYGCGVIEHDPACLCDVHIPHPTGWVDDAIQDMWMGQEIARLMDYRMPWEEPTIVHYLESLVYAKDNWPRTFGMSADEAFQWAGDMRTAIKQKLDAGSPSITVVMDELGLDMEKMNEVLFANRREWTLEKLEEFERAVRSGKYSNPGALGKPFGLPYKSAVKLASYWRPQFPENHNKTISLVIDEVIQEHPDMDNKSVATIATERLNGMGVIVSIKLDRVYGRRFLLKKKKGCQ